MKSALDAATSGDSAAVQTVLRQHPGLVPRQGPVLLQRAAAADHVAVLNVLLTAGVLVDAAFLSRTPLAAAADAGALIAVRWLLDHGAAVDGRVSDDDSTPLHAAIASGQLPAVKLLIERGADASLTDGNPPRNALAAARFWGHEDIAAYVESTGQTAIIAALPAVDIDAPAFFADDGSPLADWFAARWPHVLDRATDAGVASLSDRNRVFFNVGLLIDCVAGGGVTSYYTGPAGAHAAELPAALDAIGAAIAAKQARAIHAQFRNGVPPRSDAARRNQFRAAAQKANADLAGLARAATGSRLLKELRIHCSLESDAIPNPKTARRGKR